MRRPAFFSVRQAAAACARHRFKSSFFRFFFPLLGLIAILMLAVFFFSYRLVLTNFAHQTANAEMNMLMKTSEGIDLSLGYLEERIRSVASNESVISAVVAPDNGRVERTVEIQQLLNNTRAGSNLVENVYFYVAYDGTVYAAQEKFHAGETVDPLEVIAHYDALPEQGPGRRICNYREHAYLLQEFPLTGEDRLGVIVFQLDGRAFAQMVRGDHDPADELLICDGYLEPLMPADFGTGETDFQALMEAWNGAGTALGYRVFASEENGLTFFYRSAATSDGGEFWAMALPILPVLTLILLAGILFAVVISAYAYRPIREFVKTASGDMGPGGADQDEALPNEIDYLHQLFKETAKANREMGSMLRNLIPEMEYRLLADLLDHPLSEQYVQNYLTGISSSLAGSGQYLAMLIALSPPQAADTERYPLSSFTSEARQAVLAWSGGENQARLISDASEQWAILLTFPAEVTAAEVERAGQALLQMLQDIVRPIDVPLRAGIGRCKQTLTQLRASFDEAGQSLRLSGARREDPGQPVSLARMEAALEEIADAAMQGDRDGAQRRADALRGELLRSAAPGQQAVMLHRFAEALSRSYRQCGVKNPPSVFYEPEGGSDAELLRQFSQRLELLCAAHVDMLFHVFSKRSNRLIYLAKRYIGAHYQDGLLSLNDVAEAIGVNASYLSTLFPSVTGMRFTEYLGRCRIAAAKRELLETDRPIKEISALCGFNSVQNFTRVFRQYADCSPTQYRQGAARTP
ncbi:helix-turn-helix domain-containing protein [uncultured Oscillibacter sp.]|uniref:helix-turn-helix domain-containing protein n=1 Tax=uncultured Oscillibacter sp. TaxID=876091 RepID=UPI002806462C|nr:helix-turn-helix domain-containing protein [uncultured Oscillibacter sp.]